MPLCYQHHLKSEHLDYGYQTSLFVLYSGLLFCSGGVNVVVYVSPSSLIIISAQLMYVSCSAPMLPGRGKDRKIIKNDIKIKLATVFWRIRGIYPYKPLTGNDLDCLIKRRWVFNFLKGGKEKRSEGKYSHRKKQGGAVVRVCAWWPEGHRFKSWSLPMQLMEVSSPYIDPSLPTLTWYEGALNRCIMYSVKRV